MSIAELAGMIAAVAFVALVALAAIPLVKLGRVLDDLQVVVRDLGDRSRPLLDDLRDTVAATNGEIGKLGVVTTDLAEASAHATTVAENAATMSKLVTATVGRPLVRTAASTHALKTAIAAKRGRA